MRTWLYSEYLESPTTAKDPSTELARWPPEIRALLDEIRTIEALEVLCAVTREPFRVWRVSELPGARSSDGVAFTEAVLHLVVRGLLRRNEDGSVQFGASGARRSTVHALCRLYDDDRSGVLAALAQLCIRRVRTIAARTHMGTTRLETDDSEEP
jgi:hypothetical protein